MRLDDIEEPSPSGARIHLVMTTDEDERQALQAFCQAHERASEWDIMFDYLVTWMPNAIARKIRRLKHE